MGKSNRKYEKKPFESDLRSSDTSSNIYESMMKSDAWKDLTPTAKSLYLACKSQYYAEKKKPVNNESATFTMNRAKWVKVRRKDDESDEDYQARRNYSYELYDEGNAKGFQRDMAALINHGLVECVMCGAKDRIKSIYRFSDMWHNYGTPNFEVSDDAKTYGMRGFRKREKKSDKKTHRDGNL